MGVAQQDLDAFLAAQLLLVAALHTQLADVVARLVVVVILDVAGRHLTYVAQDVGGIRVLILADAAFLHVETREAEHLLLKHAELLVRQLTHEQLLRETRVARVLRAVLDVVHALDEKFLRDAQCLTEFHGVQSSALLVHDHHDVVGGLVVHQQFAVAVGDDAARRIFNLLQESIRVGILLVVVAHQLQREETDDVDRNDEHGHTTYHIAAVVEIKIFHAEILQRKYSMVSSSTAVMAKLPPTHSNQCCQLTNVNASRAKKASV